MKLIFHPGHSKCGSSVIQKSIYSNREALFQQGVGIPNTRFEILRDLRSARKFNTSLLDYFSELKRSKNLESFKADLKGLLRNANELSIHTIIISSENLTSHVQKANELENEIYQILKEQFEEVTTVYYIRKQDDFLLSAWQQWDHKAGQSLEGFINHSLRTHSPDFLARIGLFDSIFGSGHLRVGLINKQLLKDRDLVTDFYFKANLELKSIEVDDEVVNPSLNPFLCDILSRAPSLYQSHSDNSIKQALNSLVKSKDLLYKRNKHAISDQRRNEILAHFEQDNRALHERFFSQVPFDDIFQHSNEEPPSTDQSEIEQLKDQLALQLEMILHLDGEINLKKKESFKKCQSLLKKRFRFLKKKLKFP